jgi:peptidoglycan hydrolase CwlO-like protein
MKKNLFIATVTLGLLASMFTTNVHAATKAHRKGVVKTHSATKKHTTGKTSKKKKHRVTHSMRRHVVNSTTAPLITQ